ncbi:MAG: SDR family oxidoreductase [Pseudolabrys sp.]|jgi:NAD(P)-dependent dehydrogenase (short-subunit alcohol dehydrogenase family)
MGALSGKSLLGMHALVTGGGSGIGAAIARALAAEGAALSLAGRRKAPLDAMAKQLPKTVAIAADITHEHDCRQMAESAHKAHGPIDIVIANAGMASSAPAHKIDAAHWQQMIGVNLTGAFNTVQSALADVTRQPGGRIVFIASTAGLKGYPYVAAYVAAKHGVVGLMRALSVELAAKGVTVNAVCPGFTDTPLLANAVDTITSRTGRSADASRAEVAKDNPHGRLITPDEVAQTVLWLCAPSSGSVNGQAIAVTGGAV